jgi:hypothetical protein
MSVYFSETIQPNDPIFKDPQVARYAEAEQEKMAQTAQGLDATYRKIEALVSAGPYNDEVRNILGDELDRVVSQGIRKREDFEIARAEQRKILEEQASRTSGSQSLREGLDTASIQKLSQFDRNTAIQRSINEREDSQLRINQIMGLSGAIRAEEQQQLQGLFGLAGLQQRDRQLGMEMSLAQQQRDDLKTAGKWGLGAYLAGSSGLLEKGADALGGLLGGGGASEVVKTAAGGALAKGASLLAGGTSALGAGGGGMIGAGTIGVAPTSTGIGGGMIAGDIVGGSLAPAAPPGLLGGAGAAGVAGLAGAGLTIGSIVAQSMNRQKMIGLQKQIEAYNLGTGAEDHGITMSPEEIQYSLGVGGPGRLAAEQNYLQGTGFDEFFPNYKGNPLAALKDYEGPLSGGRYHYG